MFKDRDNALKRMEQALLEEETQALPEIDEEDWEKPWEDDSFYDFEEAQTPYVGKYEAYNSDVSDEDLDDYSRQVEGSSSGGSLLKLALTALGLMAAILAVMAYWVFRFLGV